MAFARQIDQASLEFFPSLLFYQDIDSCTFGKRISPHAHYNLPNITPI
jgi:hypothetical protein